MPHAVMKHEIEPKQALLDALGNIGGFEIFNNQILCAVYIKPEKTRSGLIIPDNGEDRFQGKIALVVRKGPDAFRDNNGEWFNGIEVKEGDWVFFRSSDGWSVTLNGVLCRIVEDVNVRGRVQHPDSIW